MTGRALAVVTVALAHGATYPEAAEAAAVVAGIPSAVDAVVDMLGHDPVALSGALAVLAERSVFGDRGGMGHLVAQAARHGVHPASIALRTCDPLCVAKCMGIHPILICGMESDGSLDLSYSCITGLPDGLCLPGVLNLTGCLCINRLPLRMVVEGAFLASRSGIERMPEDSRVDGDVQLGWCGKLLDLSAGARFGGSVDATWSNLEGWLPGAHIRGDGGFCHCHNLADIPDGTRVEGDLALCGSGMKRLGRGLWVGGNLDIRDCGAWDGILPDDLHVGGAVFR